MNSGKNVKKILFIALSIFIGNYLIMLFNMIFKNQILAVMPNYYYRSFVIQLVEAILSVVLLFVFHKTYVFKFNAKVLKEGFFCSLPLIVLYMFVMLVGFSKFSGNQLIRASEIVCAVFEWILIGVAEEGLFRGVVYELFSDIFGKKSRKGVYLTIVTSASVFGLCHLTNLFAPGISFAAVILQVVSAIAVGIVFGAIKFRSYGSIWPTVFVHAFVDASGFILGGMLWGGTTVDSINDLDPRGIFMIPFLIGIAIFLMRKSKTEELVLRDI